MIPHFNAFLIQKSRIYGIGFPKNILKIWEGLFLKRHLAGCFPSIMNRLQYNTILLVFLFISFPETWNWKNIEPN